MSDRLEVDSGDEYEINSGRLEEWSGLDQQGNTKVHGQLRLVDDPDLPADRFEVDNKIDLPMGLTLPRSSINLINMEMGIATFLVGILALLLGASAMLRNYAAGVMWAFSIVALLMSGLLGVGLELFWATVIATVLMLIMGMIVRWVA